MPSPLCPPQTVTKAPAPSVADLVQMGVTKGVTWEAACKRQREKGRQSATKAVSDTLRAKEKVREKRLSGRWPRSRARTRGA